MKSIIHISIYIFADVAATRLKPPGRLVERFKTYLCCLLSLRVALKSRSLCPYWQPRWCGCPSFCQWFPSSLLRKQKICEWCEWRAGWIHMESQKCFTSMRIMRTIVPFLIVGSVMCTLNEWCLCYKWKLTISSQRMSFFCSSGSPKQDAHFVLAADTMDSMEAATTTLYPLNPKGPLPIDDTAFTLIFKAKLGALFPVVILMMLSFSFWAACFKVIYVHSFLINNKYIYMI